MRALFRGLIALAVCLLAGIVAGFAVGLFIRGVAIGAGW